MMGRMFYGGCFTGDTLVHVTAVADGEDVADYSGHGAFTTATATATQCLAIAKVPIGARVLAINPRPEEFDDSFAEPVQSDWARVSFLIVRNDLSVVEAEFIRPRAWIESLGLVKGARLDLAVPELGIDGLAEVTAVRPCPPIAEGEGRVVTGRFVTRDVANVVRITLANGTEIRATDVHPVWSIDREDWVPAGELEPGEHVDTLTGPVAVLGVERIGHHPAVYNLEVHGEHVYRIAVDGVLVHNAGPSCASINLNANAALAHFGLYEISVNGALHKIGKAHLGRITSATGLPTRLHQQIRKLQDIFGRDNVIGQVVEDLGNTTTLSAKLAERARILQAFKDAGFVPLGNWKSFTL
jgi:hypothetical protein